MSRPCPELKFKHRGIQEARNRNNLVRKEVRFHALENYGYLRESMGLSLPTHRQP